MSKVNCGHAVNDNRSNGMTNSSLITSCHLIRSRKCLKTLLSLLIQCQFQIRVSQSQQTIVCRFQTKTLNNSFLFDNKGENGGQMSEGNARLLIKAMFLITLRELWKKQQDSLDIKNNITNNIITQNKKRMSIGKYF